MIIVESGGTKSTWVFRNANGEQVKVILGGLHPQELSQEKSDAVRQFVDQNKLIGSDVFFYGAGCESPRGSEEIKALLLSLDLNPKVIASDVVGACIAVLGNEAGVAGILGTGAVAAQYNGKKVEKMASGRGFILGDEGSGFDIGKRVTVACLDGKLSEFPEVESVIHKYYGGKDRVVHACSGPQSRFKIAGLTKEISAYRKNKVVSRIISACFQEFVEKAILPLKHYDNIGMVGSVAYHFQDELTKVLKNNGIGLDKVVPEASEAILAFIEDN